MVKMNNKSLFALSGIVISCLIVVQLFWIWNNIKLQKNTVERTVKEELAILAQDIEESSHCFGFYAKTTFNLGEGVYLVKQSYKDGKFIGPQSGGVIDTLNMFNLFNINGDSTFMNVGHVGFENYRASLDVSLKFRFLNDSSVLPVNNEQDININNFVDVLQEDIALNELLNVDQIRTGIKKILLNNNLDTSFSFGIKKESNAIYEYLSASAIPEQLSNSTIRAGLFNSEFKMPHELVVFIPNSFTNVIKSLSIMMISSIIIIILLVVLYAYFVKTILDQKRLSKMKNTFINNITHEFNTPITNINLAIENWKDVKGNDEMYMNIIREENEHMHKNVEQILQLATLEHRNMLDQKSNVDLKGVIVGAISSFDMQLKSIDAKVKVSYNANDHTIYANEGQMINMFHNLIDNAIKYRNRNTTIDITTYSTSGKLVFQITDNGIGMSSEAQKHVFDRFYREHNDDTHNVKGFGLGLSYVKYIVDLHGGEIVLKSKEGKGTSFTIYLPK